MKNFIKYALPLGLLIAFTSLSYAQSESIKIGYVDLQKVIGNSQAGKSAKSSFENEFKSKRDIIEQKARALEKMKQDFIKNSTVMNETTRKQKAEQIEKQEKDLGRTREDFREELQKKDLQLTQKIVKDIDGIMKEIGKEEGYSIILERTESGIIFANPKIDITDKIIEAYDSKQ